ncbi:MAG: GNAT family N-acetyltransferase [Anaerolineae bacterium]|nr:GNAT family N-acetyltransferase [Anaerolineae bacterium]
MTSPHNTLNLPRALGDGLVLRLATEADIDPLAEFNGQIHYEDGEPTGFLPTFTRVLMNGQHPTMVAKDFVLVEDTTKRKIISATCLIPQVWYYDGIPFKMGQPELVGTNPAYRRRGLVRLIFDTIHQLSAAYGHQLQGITGIPWFYRQFGYEFALDLGGRRALPIANVPELKEDEAEPYQIRPATETDIPALIHLYQQCLEGKLVTTPMDEARWRYELSSRTYAIQTYCIINDQQRIVGSCRGSAEVWHSEMGLWGIVVDKGVSLRVVLPGVTRKLKAHGEAYLANHQDSKDQEQKLAAIQFHLGADHPAYQAFDAKLGPLQKPYGWYIRVPDVPGFIQHVTPALEKRLANSVMSGYSGELKITFYRGGLRLVFDGGRLTQAEDWASQDSRKDGGGAGFPPLIFLKLLFGYRSLAELRDAFPDCWANEESTLLLNALFPKQPSWVVQMV